MKYYRYSMDMVKLNVFCIVLFIPILVLVYFWNFGSYMNLTTLVLYFFWMFLHEILHGIGFSFSKVNHKNIVYGANLEKGIFYCMCKELIGKKGIMVSLMFPFVLIGILTLIIGFLINSPVLIILSLFNIAGCAGDIAMFLSFLFLPGFSYIDLDDCTGFVLVSESDLSKHKLFGMNLVEVGDYDNLTLAQDYRKITVSKLSWVIFGVMLLFLLISFIV